MYTSKAPRGALLTGATALAALALATFGVSGAANAATGFTLEYESGSGHETQALGPNFNPSPSIPGISQSTVITVFNSGNDGCTPSCNTPTGLFINPGNSSITFTYLGHEASDTDLALTANLGNITLFNNQTSASGSSVTETYALGSGTVLLPFTFKDSTGGGTAPNGGPISNDLSIGFYITPDGQTAYAFFDDKNSGHPDSDFDDMVVKITFATSGNPGQTPLPAALPLFASGAGVMGLLGWRRKKKVKGVA